jgi:hypothetical protein
VSEEPVAEAEEAPVDEPDTAELDEARQGSPAGAE